MKVTVITVLGGILAAISAIGAALGTLPYPWARITSTAIATFTAVFFAGSGISHGVYTAQNPGGTGSHVAPPPQKGNRNDQPTQ